VVHHSARYVSPTMDAPVRPSNPRITGAVDAARLFAQAETVFAGLFEIERVVAASAERMLLVARDIVLKRNVALRVHMQPNTPGRIWFERESELLASLDHPGIRPVYSARYRENWAYRVSKWIEGESLEEAIERGPRPIPTILRLARDLLAALDYAHHEHVIARRVVPSSLMLEHGGRAVITDLRWANPCLSVAGPDPDSAGRPFLAPEVRDGQPGDPAGDVYAAGAVLYYAVTSRAPALDPTLVVPARDVRPHTPQALERVILRALCVFPADRYFTPAEMADDLLSDLGDYEFRGTLAPPVGADTEDPAEWEKRLRRALGDDYELLGELGSGGFGRVYRVRNLALEREEALKVLHPTLAADRDIMERFQREAQLAAAVRHPNIVDVYGTGGRAGMLWYTMAFVRGENLAQVIQRGGPLPVGRVVQLLEQSLSALQHAHTRGLIHRDLKPENVLLEQPGGHVQITDFGLALAVHGREGFGGASSHSGTPEFASPEQLLGERVDLRTDLYSISLVALYALTGHAPFTGGSVEAILAKQTMGNLPDVREVRDDVPDELLAVIAKGASRDPAERFPSAEAYLVALRDAMRRWRMSPRRFLRRILG